MKRLMRSNSGRQIYGQKWQNVEPSNEIESHGSLRPTETAAAPPAMAETNFVTEPGTGSHRRSMYQASLGGDWIAAEMLLEHVPSLARDHLTERGERALHVAVAMEHKEFVQKLVERMSPSELEMLQDGHGYTACCYAAISGMVEIAELLIRKNPKLGTTRDENKVTPLQKAASRGNAKMVSYFLEYSKDEDLLDEEWFNLLLETIRCRNYGVALEVLQKNGCIATMTNEEGTALHLLARQVPGDIYTLCGFKYYDGRMRPDLRLLAEKLWTEIQKLGQECVVELMKKPPVLHVAAKTGMVELITMLTRACPDLIWQTDSDGYTVFHIAVIHKQESVFSLIYQIGAMKDFIAITRDENGNNILHLAAKLTTPDRYVKLLKMKREITWFERVKKVVPPSCLRMMNKAGLTPDILFTEEHKWLLQETETWLRNTADSCMLISTIILTVVFAAAFTVPGGYDGQTGIPILISKSYWFTTFVISEAATLFASIQAILQFWKITTSIFDARDFLTFLPTKLAVGLSCLLLSLVGTLSAILSAYFLVYVDGTGWLVVAAILCVYAWLILQIGFQFFQYVRTLQFVVMLKKLSRPDEPSLFRQQGTNRKDGN